jgi:hypothetical protein
LYEYAVLILVPKLINKSKIQFFIANFHVLGLFIPKNQFKANFFFRLSRGVAGVAVGFWTKFKLQLAQPCQVLES